MEKLNKGIELLKEDNLDEAIAIFDQILESDSENIDALLNKGIALYEDDEFALAVELFDKVISLDEKNVEAYFYKGNSLSNNDEVANSKELAIENYTKAIELDENHIPSLMNRGIEYYTSNELNKAVTDFDKILNLDKKNKVAYLHLANTLRRGQRLEDALKLYNTAISLDKDFLAAYVERSIVYHMMKDLVSAENDIKKVLDKNPNHLNGLINKAKLLLSLNKKDESIKIFEDLYNKYPDNYEVCFMQGFIAQTERSLETAVMYYGKALQSDPRAVPCHHNLARVFMELKDINRAYLHISTAIKISPKVPILYLERGNIYLLTGRADLAFQDFSVASEGFPTNKEILEKKARAGVLSKNFEPAFEIYEKFHKDEPQNPFWVYTIGWANLQKGDFDKSLEYLNKALEMKEDLAPAIADRAVLYSKMQKFEEAKADYEKVISMSPQVVENYLNFAQLYITQKDFDNAIAICDKYIAINDRDPRTYMIKGNIYRSEKAYNKAIEVYTDVLDITNDSFVDAYLARATTYKDLENYEHALEDFSSAINLQPKNPNLLFARSKCLYDLKDFNRAISDLNKALELQPQNGNIYKSRALCHEGLGNTEAAQKDYDMADKLFKNLKMKNV